MARDGEKGSFSADIPADLLAEALAAVEKREAAPAADPGAAHEAAAGDEVARLRAQVEAAHDLRLRAAADLENLRKRGAREKEEAQRLAVERLVKDLLPVLDNLDRALAALPEGPLALGVSMTRRLLEETLARHGVKALPVEPGMVFDPHVHQALMAAETEDRPAGTIVEQHQRGYFLHDRLIRPASVVVAAASGGRRGEAGESGDPGDA